MHWIDCFPIFVLVHRHCSTSLLHGHLSHVNNSPFTVEFIYFLVQGVTQFSPPSSVAWLRPERLRRQLGNRLLWEEFQSLCYSMYSTLVIHTWYNNSAIKNSRQRGAKNILITTPYNHAIILDLYTNCDVLRLGYSLKNEHISKKK